jgi:hypothetical protein
MKKGNIGSKKESNKQVSSKQDILVQAWQVPKYKLNCYAYGLGLNVGRGGYYKNRLYKARPGDKCLQFTDREFDFQRCEDIVARILCDNPAYVRKVKPDKISKYLQRDIGDNHHFMAAYLSPGIGNHIGTDFHFLRRTPLNAVAKQWHRFKKYTPQNAIDQIAEQNPSYLFTHRRGWSRQGPLLVDAKGDIITDPRTADLDYGEVNYRIFCGLFLVETRKSSVSDRFDF